MNNTQQKHFELLDAVNHAKTTQEHRYKETYLSGWRAGAEDALGHTLDYTVCDLYYLNQGVNRPMCCGIWLDWEPKD